MRSILVFLIFAVNFSLLAAQEPEYIFRIMHGEATYSDLSQIILNNTYEKDRQDGSFDGIQLEKYIARDYKGKPIDITLMGGFFWHHQDIKDPDDEYASPSKLTEEDTYQLNAGLKLYWKKFPWNRFVRTRLAILEGVSYTEHIINIERQNKNRRSSKKTTSNLLNYLETSLAFNLGDICRKSQLEPYYLGIGVSHRSGIFGTVNNVNGGSNFISFFLESHF